MTKFRPTREDDRTILESFIALDEEHSQTSTSDFWLPPKIEHKGAKYLAVEDENGVIGFLVLENVLRIHSQFAPASEILRTRPAVASTLTQIQKWAASQYREVIFESVSSGLVWFVRKFGFRRSKNEVVCRLQEQ